jgi:hypothetical protein
MRVSGKGTGNAHIQNGLLREIAELRAVATELYGSAGAVDHAEGIFQSIGTFCFNRSDRHSAINLDLCL